MATFSNFFISSVSGKKLDPTATATTKSGGTWDVVLFLGDYNPITKYEHDRISQFVVHHIKDKSKEQFTKDAEVALLCDYQFDNENDILMDKFKYNLSLADKEYVSARLFGLRLFPINIRDLMLFAASSEEEQTSSELTTSIFKLFSEIFEGCNILIVLRPQDEQILGKLEHIVDQAGVRIGFTVWKYEPTMNGDYIDNNYRDGNLIKALVLMDQYRPFPEDLKAFSYKYKLGNYLQDIRNIHLKVSGDKYIIALMGLFPNISLNEESEVKISNYLFIMELLKKMYLGAEYKNVTALNRLDNDTKAMPSGLGVAGGSGSAGSGDSSAGGSEADFGASAESTPPESGLEADASGESPPSEPPPSDEPPA